MMAEKTDAVSQLKAFHMLTFINASLMFDGHCLENNTF
jgi:hypothetical protein